MKNWLLEIGWSYSVFKAWWCFPLPFLLRIWLRSHMVSPTVLFLCWSVGNRVLPLGAMISFVQPACPFDLMLLGALGQTHSFAEMQRKLAVWIFPLWWSLVMFMHISFVFPLGACWITLPILLKCGHVACFLLMEYEWRWDVSFLAQESCESRVSAHPASAVFQRVKLSTPPF